MFTKGDMFPSWTALLETIERYQREQYVQLWRRDSRKLETAQKRFHNRSFNSELVYYEVSWNCVHGGRIHKSRSGGNRPNSSTYRQACPFVMKFRATMDGQKLELVNFNDRHTHEISAAIYEHYPSQRRLDDDTKTEVANMLKVGANRKLLLRHVFEKTGKRVLLRDIHNLGYQTKLRPTPSKSKLTLRKNRDHRVFNICHKTPLRPVSDPISQAYQQLVTKYAFKRIHQQLQARDKVAIGDSTQPDHYTVESPEGSIQVTSSSCTCTTFISTQLPCCHIFRVREHLQQELYCPNLIAERWIKMRYRKAHQVFQESEASSDVSVTNLASSSTPCVPSQVEKFKRATVVTQKLAYLISDSDMPDYTQRMHVLQQLLSSWEAGTIAGVVEIVIPSTCVETIPSTSVDTIPSAFVETIPFTSVETIPSTCVETIPSTSVETIPSTCVETIPTTSVETIPTKSVENISSTNVESIPSTNVESIPSTNVEIIPSIRTPSKRRRLDKPQPFIKKSANKRDCQMLGWFVGPDKASDALHSKLLFGEEDVEQDPIAVPEACLDDSVNLEWLHRYFDSDGWTAVQHVYQQKAQDPHWECLQCQQDLHSQDSIRCDSCLMWFHLHCQLLLSTPNKKYWYCGSCK